MSASTPELKPPESDGADEPPTAAGEESAAGDRGRRGVDRRMILPLVVIVVIAGGFALLFQNTSRNSQPLADGTHSARSTSFLGDELSPPKAAPPLSLRNYLGERINIHQYRGKALLVTFLYTHCPEICPLITADLHSALGLMSPKTAAKVQIIAVSVDPRGDTPRTVAAYPKGARDDRAHEVPNRHTAGTRARLAEVGRGLRT